MDYVRLGATNIYVSKLCFGSLTIGPLQANLSIKDGSSVICKALDMGVNFIDTAELYKNYEYIREAVKGRRNNVVISSKSYAYTKEGAKESLEKALKEINTDYIDIFSLHEQESDHTIRGHYDAIEYFIKAKEKGYIKAIGISTHTISGVEASLKYNDIEIIHPIVNIKGLGIIDGNLTSMLKAIERAYNMGKGIYSMKPLGGGNLSMNAYECIRFVLENKHIHSIALGMQTEDEVINNVLIFQNEEVPKEIKDKVVHRNKHLHIDYWCKGCGVCCKYCHQGALSLVDGFAHVDMSKCTLCGYCSSYCTDFCIKIV